MLPLKLKILVTGATGFIGQNLLNSDEFSKHELLTFSIRNNDFRSLDLSDVNAIIYLSGISSNNASSDEIYYANETLPIEFAAFSKSLNISQFIFISTTKVYGDDNEKTDFSLTDDCKPSDDYGKSKLNAELGIMNLESEYFKVTVVRPAVVYGAGVKGNLNALLKLIQKGIPLPFKKIDNLRSMVYVGNLINFIHFTLVNEITGVYIVTDNNDVSTSNLFSILGNNLGSNTTLFYLPKPARLIIKKLKPNIYNRLFKTLTYKVEKTYKEIGYTPPYSLHFGLKVMAENFQSQVK